MSAFDDEFGLFGEGEEDLERRSTLGARKIATGETIIDDIEPEDERPPRRFTPSGERSERRPHFKDRPKTARAPVDPELAQQRAGDLLGFLAKKLVAKPEAVSVEIYDGERGIPVLELAVDPEDLGKVIGRAGRVAHAMRTVVRATAEGKISIEILDTDEAFEDEDEDQDVDGTQTGEEETTSPE
ncbi:MAG: KH domain-containing protein [Candidatus Baltobacteraceae bacterium]